MSINTKNTFGAEIRNKLSTILIAEELIREKIKDPLQSINMMFDNTEELLNNIQSAIGELKDLADKLKDMPIEPKYKDLGEKNSWVVGEYPHEYIMCMTAEHELQEIKLNDAGTHREYCCPKCLIFWKTDSSD